jgi:hypothetical protein
MTKQIGCKMPHLRRIVTAWMSYLMWATNRPRICRQESKKSAKSELLPSVWW